MAWAALSCWISRRGALLAQGATPEHRAEGGRGTEVSRQLSAWCCVWRCQRVLQGWEMEGDAEQMCLRRLPACVGQGEGAEPQWLWWSSVSTVAFHLGSVNLISVSLPQWLPHHMKCVWVGVWAVGRPRQRELMELVIQSFGAESPLRLWKYRYKVVHAQDFKAGGFWGGSCWTKILIFLNCISVHVQWKEGKIPVKISQHNCLHIH